MTAHRLIVPSQLLIELAQVIGQDEVVKLCEALGGTRTYVPRTIGPNHPLGRALSPRAAAALAEHYYGTQLDLPKAFSRRERAIEMAKGGTMSVKDAALATDYSQRHVRRLLNDNGDEDQLALPF